MGLRYGLDYAKETFIPHAYPELTVDLGEVVLNYVVSGPESAPVLVLIPGLVESWWGYEAAIKLLEGDFRVYAVDMRGQGRSSRTPGRYTLDNWGNDLVRFLERVVRKPAVVAGSSAGGVIAAWLAAYAPPGLVHAAVLEDAPLFTSELTPARGSGIHQTAVGYLFKLFSTYLGDQWSVGDWRSMLAAAPSLVPDWMLGWIPTSEEPPQNLKEFDPEGARAFLTGTATANCSQEKILQSINTPVLFTHHFRSIDPATEIVQGATTDRQVGYARSLVEKAGQRFDYRSLPDKGHGLHEDEPVLYASIVKEWVRGVSS